MSYEATIRNATTDKAQAFAEEFLDTMAGYRVPRDGEPAWVLKCPTNGRYFHRSTAATGPITVARHHAYRFATKADACVALRACRRASKTPLRVVRICLANPKSGGT